MPLASTGPLEWGFGGALPWLGSSTGGLVCWSRGSKNSDTLARSAVEEYSQAFDTWALMTKRLANACGGSGSVTDWAVLLAAIPRQMTATI